MAVGNLVSIPELSNNQKLGLAGAALVGIGLGSAAIVASRRKKKRTKRTSSRKTYRKVKGRRYTPRTAGKGRDTSTRRIRHTSNGQPYVIMASGKARFISKKSAKSSRKRAGGRY